MEPVMHDPQRSLRKILAVLFISQSLYRAGMIIIFTVGSILVVQMADGNSRWTGVPTTLQVIGAAFFAYPMGRLMDRIGRRNGLSLGFFIGIGGATLAGIGAITRSLGVFLLAAFIIGLARATLDMGRYAAAEASPPERRGRSISFVIFGGAIGSVLGPVIIALANNLGTRWNLPYLSGPWFLAGALFSLALVILFLGLRPDPKRIAQQLQVLPGSGPKEKKEARKLRVIFQDPKAILAIGAMVFGTLTMVLVMVITPIYMTDLGHPLGTISVVIMAHTLGMFGLSFLTGWMVDKVGRVPIIAAGGLILIVACAIAPLGTSVMVLGLALFLLGLGWNLCYVAGSALLDDVLEAHEKGSVQGSTEALINVASAVGSLGSGFIFSSVGFLAMSWGTILIASLPLYLAVRWGINRQSYPIGKPA